MTIALQKSLSPTALSSTKSGALAVQTSNLVRQAAQRVQKTMPIKKSGAIKRETGISQATKPIVKQNDPIGQATVTAGSLNVRSGPGTNYARIGGVNKGRVLDVYEEKDGWLRILYNTQEGWVSKQYTDYKGEEPEITDPEPEPEPEPEVKYVKTTDALNMRDIPGSGTTPDPNSKVYLTIPAGTVLTVQDEKNGWYKVSYGGYTGWVCANWTASYTPPPTPDGKVPDGGEGVVVDVPIDPQNTSYNCGAASGAMSLAARGLKISEQEVAAQAGTNSSDGTVVYKLSNALNHFAGSGTYRYTNMKNYAYQDFFNAMKTSISAVALPVVRLKPTAMADFGYKSGGHYVCISGAYTSSSGERRFVINDPYSSKWSSSNPQGQKIDVKADDILECSKSMGDAWFIHG